MCGKTNLVTAENKRAYNIAMTYNIFLGFKPLHLGFLLVHAHTILRQADIWTLQPLFKELCLCWLASSLLTSGVSNFENKNKFQVNVGMQK